MNENSVSHLLLLPRFQYKAPETLDEVCSLLDQYNGKAKVMAGGTDLLVSMKKREETPEYIISIKNIQGLDYIKFNEGILKIGAMATLASVANSEIVNEKFGVLAMACKKVSTPQVRNMGTVAGNVAKAGPSQDTIPALLALEAKLKLVRGVDERIIPISEFFTGPFQSILESNEILSEIQVPVPPDRSAGCYLYKTKGTEMDETLAGAAVVLACDSSNQLCEDIRIGLTSVAPYPFRARKAEKMLRGNKLDENLIREVGQAAAEETKPRSRPEYRKRMTSILVRQAITESLNKIQ
ncbi:MAG TPA: xanthine dehydrogenase family protein subunit M [Desulfobacteraceae bacterium]|nr:xanthine dehydrogenase family protein subunit M [Desulfobacteraceae bacterium]HPJ67707.1 xanthine dehydrogenase family protein subunit M [Desulfobacteraceae bacterium]HPQ29420.1 xanthine dehydrogenase family protein subunit M [Desulfobacteraceae bacterium]